MNEQELQQIERAYDKALAGSGPQPLAEWASTHGSNLMDSARREIRANENQTDRLGELRKLYPGVEDARLISVVIDDVLGLRKYRAERAGTAAEEGAALGDALRGDVQAVQTQLDSVVAALRPFAAFGSPPVLEVLEGLRIAAGVDTEVPFLAVIDPSDNTVLATATRDQAIAARKLIDEIDGGAGA